MLTIHRLFDIPYYQLEKYPQSVMFSTKHEGKWNEVSTESFIKKVNHLSLSLIKHGIQEGDNIALVSSNRIEWNILDIAIQQIGAIVVPLYPNISAQDYRYIFNDASIKLAFLANQELFDKINSIKSELKVTPELFSFDVVEGCESWNSIFYDDVQSLNEELKARKSKIKYEDLATIIYTSGTTGNPKGVMLSHKNLLSNVDGCQERIPADENSRILTFLPVCHVYERMLHYLYMYLGCSIYFAESMDTIGENIKEVKPHVFSAVPRLLEKVYDKIMAKGDELTGIKRSLFFWAVAVGDDYDVKGKSAWYHFKLAIARKLIFSKWQEALGGNVNAIASGSAALQPKLARIFMAAGVPILEGYGLTETSPVVSVNCLDGRARIGTVGPLIKEVSVKIAEDGEILVKGPNVMMGYYNLPEATKEAIDEEGWFHTGDIGEFQEEIYLKITDRKKEIFKTSGGKYIVPQVMENKFKESRFIEQIIVIGEGQKFPAALIVPNFAFATEWAKRKKINGIDSIEKLIQHNDVIQRIQEEVDKFNTGFGNWEQIKKFELLPKEFSIEGGELTPTLKFKRKKIHEKYQKEIEKIYAE